MENQARVRHGKPRTSVETLAVQFAMQEVFERVPTFLLAAQDARRALYTARMRIAMTI
jgi:hypothetical protein